MKIAVTAQGNETSSQVDPRFGRARWFVIVDTESGEAEAVDNSSGAGAMSGAGVTAGQVMAERGVTTVITGHCGPNAYRTLAAAGIKVVTGAEGTVAEAVEKFRNGELGGADGPDVQGHWT